MDMPTSDRSPGSATALFPCRPRLPLAMLLVFLVALVPRVLYVLQLRAPLYSDMIAYDRCATNFLSGEGLQESPRLKAYRPPGYPFFLALVYMVTGHRIHAALLAQAVLGALNALLVVLIANIVAGGTGMAADPKARGGAALPLSFLAGVLFALCEEAIFYSGQLLSEALYVFLFTVWIAGVLLAAKGRAIVSINGLLNGFLILVRPVALFILPIGLWQAARGKNRRHALKDMLAYSLFTFLIILPWAIRNKVEIGSFSIATNGGVNFYLGHNPKFGYMSVGDKNVIREQAKLDEVRESALFYQIGIRFILDHPMRDLSNNLKKIGYLYTTAKKPWPWSQPGRELRFAGGLWLPVWAWSWPAMLLAVVGALVAFKRGSAVGVLLWSVAAQTLSSVIFHADARFRFPVIPVFAFFAAQGIVWGVQHARRLLAANCASRKAVGQEVAY